MPHSVIVEGDRDMIINWLRVNVGEFTKNNYFWSATGVGWELLPYGEQNPQKFLIRIWDHKKFFITKLCWE